MTLQTPVGRLPTPPIGWALATGPELGRAGILLAAKAALSRDMRGPLDALKRPHPSLKKPQRNLDTADTVLLDPVTQVIFCADNTFLLHCAGRTLPLLWGPSGGFSPQRHEAVAWARGLCPTWKALADHPWELAAATPQALPTPFTCPFWLVVDGWTPSEDRLLAAIAALVDVTALGLSSEAAGWTIDVYNGFVGPHGFQSGHLLYDTFGTGALQAVGALTQGQHLGLSARVQKALQQDGRLPRLLASHHLLVQQIGWDHKSDPVGSIRSPIASFTVGASSAHQRLAGLVALADLLAELPATPPLS